MRSSVLARRESRRRLGVLAAAFLVVLSWLVPTAPADAVEDGSFRLSDQEAELYYELLGAAGEELVIEGGVEATGDLHSNGGLDVKKDATVTGDVSAVGDVTLRGTVDGDVTPEAEARDLPLLLPEAELRALADRVFEEDVTFTDEVIDDVVLVLGTARIRGDVNGVGTVVATKDVRLDTTGDHAGNGGEPFVLDETTRLSLIALGDIRIGPDRPLRGVLRAGRDVTLESGVTFEGVLVADRRLHVKKDSSLTFVDFDQVSPVVELLTPAADSFVTTATPEIIVRYTDEFSGLRLDSLELLLDGDDVTAEATLEGESPEVTLSLTPIAPLAEGAHTVEGAVTDHSDNEGRESFGFVVDTVPPAVAITSPAAGTHFNIVPPVEITYSDATSGVDTTTLVVTLDGVELAGCAVGESSATCPMPEVPEGSHTLVAEVRDVAGNPASAARTFDFVLDTEGPVISLVSPEDGAAVSDVNLSVLGTVTDEASGVASVTVNGQTANLTASNFTATVSLVPGPNPIVIQAIDAVGNSSSLTVTVVLGGDSTPPTLRITSPVAETFVIEARPAIDVSFDDDDSGVDTASLVFTANGSALPATCDFGAVGGRCTPTVDLPEGPVSLEAQLQDEAGNTATDAVQVVVDTEGLEVVVTSPADGTVTRDGQVTVTGTVSVDVEEIEVNGVPATLSGRGFSALVPLREGVNMVVALATKPNGRTGTGSVEVTRDLTAPIVRIDSPADGSVSISPSIPVVGLVNDTVGSGSSPTVEVNGIPATVAGGGFLIEDLVLVPGPNRIEAVATDAVGNESRHSIDVTFQPPVGVRIGFGSGNGQLGFVDQTLAEPLTAVVTDDLGNPVAGRLVRFEVSRNSGTLQTSLGGSPERVVQIPTNGAGRASVFFTLGDTAGEGNNRVRASAVGVAGEVEFCASALPEAPDKILMVEGDNQRGVVGQPLAQPLEALVVDVNGNPLAGLPVTFEVVRGSGTLDGQDTLVRETDIQGVARAVFTLGTDAGINNNVVRATFAGSTGLPASFISSGLAPGDPAQTRFSGVVLDNGHTPIPGAAVTIDGHAGEAITDAQGQFELVGVPVGHIHLVVDPTDSPRPEVFPPLAFETITVAGQDNTLGQPILIPALDANTRIVGGDQDVTLTMEGVEGLTLTVFANSVTFPDGSKVGPLSISQVHLDKVPMPPPSGTFFMPPAWTIQPSGVKFDPPARITIPNDGLPPGRVIDIFQFDHGLNEFINVGKGEVSQDALLIESMPGFGITRAGWGGCGQPQPPDTCTDGCKECKKCQDGSCVPNDGAGCDDGKFCTSFTGEAPGPDKCQGGSCRGKAIPDEVVEAGLDFALGPQVTDNLQTIARATQIVPGCELENEDLAVDLNITVNNTRTCCEKEKDFILVEEISGGASLGLTAECNIIGLPIPGDVVEIDLLQFSLTLAGQLSAKGKINDCDGCSWEVGGNVTLTPALGAEIELPGDILEINVDISYPGSFNAVIVCGDPDIFGCAGPLTVSGSATFVDFEVVSFSVAVPGTEFCLGKGE